MDEATKKYISTCSTVGSNIYLYVAGLVNAQTQSDINLLLLTFVFLLCNLKQTDKEHISFQLIIEKFGTL